MSRAASIALTELSVKYGNRKALDRISLEIDAGQRVAIIGPSGSGKSTLLRCLAGLQPAAGGEVCIGGQLATSRGRHLLAPDARGMAMVFQDLGLWPHLTVHQTLAFTARRSSGDTDRRAAIRQTIERLGLTGRERARPGALSGGEQQRLALGRALVAEPGVLLLDEPFAALDIVLRKRLVETLLTLHRDLGFTLIQVTHDPLEAIRVAERVVLLDTGRVAWQGAAAELEQLDEGLGAELNQALRWWRATPSAESGGNEENQ